MSDICSILLTWTIRTFNDKTQLQALLALCCYLHCIFYRCSFMTDGHVEK